MSLRDYYKQKLDQAEKGHALFSLIKEDLQRANMRVQTAFDHFETEGLGATFTNGRLFGMVLPDPQGGFRYQLFQIDGFVSHGSRQTAEECVFALADDYQVCQPVPKSTLDALASTPEWARGSFRVDLIRQVNSGQISMEEGNKLAIEYDKANGF